MRILQVCPGYCPYLGGVEEHVRNISERLAKDNEVTVVTTDPSGKLPKEEIINALTVVRFKSWAPHKLYYLSEDLRQYLKVNANNFDIMHAHNYHAFPAFYASGIQKKNKFVFTAHYHGTGTTFFTSLLNIPYKYLGKRVFEKADKIVCVSNYEMNLVNTHFKLDRSKIEVIPNGVDFGELENLKRHTYSGHRILYVGRLEKYKGVHHVIRALSRLDETITLDIVGQGSFKKDLVEIVKKLRLEQRVRFSQELGRVDLLQKYLDSDVFILLSEHESYGICVAEALSVGTPCIVSNTSALCEWIDNENCFGIGYPVDIDVLSNLIERTLGKRASVKKILDWTDVVQKLQKLYESTLY